MRDAASKISDRGFALDPRGKEVNPHRPRRDAVSRPLHSSVHSGSPDVIANLYQTSSNFLREPFCARTHSGKSHIMVVYEVSVDKTVAALNVENE